MSFHSSSCLLNHFSVNIPSNVSKWCRWIYHLTDNFFCITLLIGTGVGRFQGKVLNTPPLQKFELDWHASLPRIFKLLNLTTRVFTAHFFPAESGHGNLVARLHFFNTQHTHTHTHTHVHEYTRKHREKRPKPRPKAAESQVVAGFSYYRMCFFTTALLR